MKKLIIASFLVLGSVGVSHADQAKFKVPVSVNNIADPLLQSAGVEKITLVTSSIPALATDRLGNNFTDGLIYWVIVPSTLTLQTVFLEMRDTATANATSARIMPTIGTNVLLSTATLFGGTAQGAVVNFNPPVPFYNGLSLNLTPGTVVPAGNAEFAVGIRSKRQ